jgi:hypothetical protein
MALGHSEAFPGVHEGKFGVWNPAFSRRGIRYASDLGSVKRSLLFGQFRRLKPGLQT